MSKATVVSICPFPIREEKPGLVPGIFTIGAAKEGDLEVLVVGDSTHTIRIPVQGTRITSTEPAETIAAAIVNDRLTGQLLFKPDCKPGLFWVPGEHTKESIAKNHALLLQDAIRYQRNWFTALVKLADDDWAQYHQHKFISDIQRHAGKVLGVERDWLTQEIAAGQSKCPACYTNVDPRATICFNCKTVLKKEDKKG